MRKTFLIAIMMVFAAGMIFGACAGEDSLEAKVKMLEQKVTTLEDIEAINKLERAYGYFLEHLMVDEIADLWAKDGVLEWIGQGRFIGQDKIRKQWGETKESFAKRGDVVHPGARYHGYVTINPDGKTATGRWYVAGFSHAMEFLCENQYVKEDGVWKYKLMQVGAFSASLTNFPNNKRSGGGPGGGPGGAPGGGPGGAPGGAPGGGPGGALGGAPGGAPGGAMVVGGGHGYEFSETLPRCPRQEDENYLRPFSFKHPVTGKDVNVTVEAWNKAHPCKE